MRRPAAQIFHAGAVAATLLLQAAVARAAPPADPDWPCQQRLVARISPGVYWPQPPPGAGRADDPAVRAAAARAAGRLTPTDAGAQWLAAFVADAPEAERAGVAADVFADVAEALNRNRDSAIDGIKRVTRRQRDVAAALQRVEEQTRALPEAADAAQRTELADRRLLVMRQFDEVQQTIRYACEVPVDIEAKLGAYARALQAAAVP